MSNRNDEIRKKIIEKRKNSLRNANTSNKSDSDEIFKKLDSRRNTTEIIKEFQNRKENDRNLKNKKVDLRINNEKKLKFNLDKDSLSKRKEILKETIEKNEKILKNNNINISSKKAENKDKTKNKDKDIDNKNKKNLNEKFSKKDQEKEKRQQKINEFLDNSISKKIDTFYSGLDLRENNFNKEDNIKKEKEDQNNKNKEIKEKKSKYKPKNKYKDIDEADGSLKSLLGIEDEKQKKKDKLNNDKKYNNSNENKKENKKINFVINLAIVLVILGVLASFIYTIHKDRIEFINLSNSAIDEYLNKEKYVFLIKFKNKDTDEITTEKITKLNNVIQKEIQSENENFTVTMSTTDEVPKIYFIDDKATVTIDLENENHQKYLDILNKNELKIDDIKERTVLSSKFKNTYTIYKPNDNTFQFDLDTNMPNAYDFNNMDIVFNILDENNEDNINIKVPYLLNDNE